MKPTDQILVNLEFERLIKSWDADMLDSLIFKLTSHLIDQDINEDVDNEH